jgi:ABC-type antimicrobial peptide transport system permease subunit
MALNRAAQECPTILTMPVDFDWTVLAFTVGVSLVTGFLFDIVPAWQATTSTDTNPA